MGIRPKRREAGYNYDWLDSDGRLQKGKYRGKLVEDVAKSDVEYLKWIVREVEECSDEDREVMEAMITWHG